jgi:hypothetical protein
MSFRCSRATIDSGISSVPSERIRVRFTGAHPNAATGAEIYYAGHTNNTDYRSVAESLALSGGSVSYWSVN